MSEDILNLEAVNDDLEGKSIAQLRSYAKLYNVPLSRDMTAEDIKAAVRLKKKKHNMVSPANVASGPAPGRWRIIVHKTTDFGAGAGSGPVTVKVNGAACVIPRNVAVDVPEKIVRCLENSYHYISVERDNGTWGFEPQLTYPFQVLSYTDGPDPTPGYEKSKLRNYRMRLAFRDEFGYWPKNQAMLREAVEKGHIKKIPLPSGEYSKDE